MIEERLKVRVWRATQGEMYIPRSDEAWPADPIAMDYYGTMAFQVQVGDALMQCTGIKDRAGRLVYEGDVVSVGSSDMRFVVRWLDEICSFIAVGVGSARGPDGQKTPGAYCMAAGRVIGNIYENRELMEATCKL